MTKIETSLPGILLLEPRVFRDDRGYFLESYNERVFVGLGIREKFVQRIYKSALTASQIQQIYNCAQ